jgi:hypothetical protein
MCCFSRCDVFRMPTMTFSYTLHPTPYTRSSGTGAPSTALRTGASRRTRQRAGILECWSVGRMGKQSITPALRALVCALYPRFHHSNVPLFLHSMNPAGLGSTSCENLSPISATRSRREASPSAPSGGSVRENAVVRSCRAFGSADPVCLAAVRATRVVSLCETDYACR